MAHMNCVSITCRVNFDYFQYSVDDDMEKERIKNPESFQNLKRFFSEISEDKIHF